MKDIIVGGRYRIDKKIGQGGFGLVYAGTDLQSTRKVAIKLMYEPNGFGAEAEILEKLAGGTGIPEIYWCGEEYNYFILVHEILGASLEDLLTYCGRRFSLKTLLLIAIQAISRIEYVHSKGFLHCDVKANNFLLGLGKQANTLYMIDFGISKFSFKPGETPSTSAEFMGTRVYSSINALKKIEQSWRDDLESLGYMLVYCFNGSLPWAGVKATDVEEKERLLLDQKCSVKVDDLCVGLPTEFATYMNYVRGLAFNQRPDYAYLRDLFDQLFRRSEFRDEVFDWTEKMMERISSLPYTSHGSLTERPRADTPGC